MRIKLSMDSPNTDSSEKYDPLENQCVEKQYSQ